MSIDRHLFVESRIHRVVLGVAVLAGLLVVYDAATDVIDMRKRRIGVKTVDAGTAAILPHGDGHYVLTNARLDLSGTLDDGPSQYVPLIPLGGVNSAPSRMVYVKVSNMAHGALVSVSPTTLVGQLEGELPADLGTKLYNKTRLIPSRTQVFDLAAPLPPSIYSITGKFMMAGCVIVGAMVLGSHIRKADRRKEALLALLAGGHGRA